MLPTRRQCLGAAIKHNAPYFILTLAALVFLSWTVLVDVYKQAEIESAKVQMVRVAK